MILIDSNILIDMVSNEHAQSSWSRQTFAMAQVMSPVVVNVVILAETAARFATWQDQAGFLSELGIAVVPLDPAAAHRAGLAFRDYCRRGGPREAILADFLIGGHAVVIGAALMTRDRGRFSSYFPELTLITPETPA